MSIVRVGTTKKYADGWDAIFGSKRNTKKPVSSAKRARRAARRKKK